MWHKILLVIAVIINVLLLGRLFLDPQGIEGYTELRADSNELEKQLQEVEQKNIALSREIELLNSDDKYIEKIIRNKLNFVKNNEILYLFQEAQPPSSRGATSDDGKN